MRYLPLIGAASVVALGAAALALPAAKPSKMDSDGNGVVSKAEATSAANAMFARMDQNADGTINAADRDAEMKMRFQKMDADKNGAISESEFLAIHQQRMEERHVKRAERGEKHGHHGGRKGAMGAAMVLLKAADSNQDMTVTKAEFQAEVDARFVKADTDKNGSLSAAEQKAARKAMRTEMRDRLPPMEPEPGGA